MTFLNALSAPSQYEINQLTTRELQCIDYLLQGFNNKNIATKLHLSPRTVEAYIENIKEKLCCKSKIELIIKLTKHYCQISYARYE